MKNSIFSLILLAATSLFAADPAIPDAANSNPPPLAWKSAVPRPVFDADPSLVVLYNKAWELAWGNVKDQPGLPQSPYMDEGCPDMGNCIWIWDTCFMSLFCKYAPDTFPGVGSMRNFYVLMHGDKKNKVALRICHQDNPPLFSWAEYDNYKFTNDRAHIDKLITQEQYLQKHFAWFSNPTHGPKPTALVAEPDGFKWNGVASGMDNTPRRRDGSIYWVDAIAQQGLSALYISRLADSVGNAEEAARWKETFETLKKKVNDLYWDELDGIYYDIKTDTKAKSRIRTPASFWPMFAEMCTQEQAARLVKHLEDPNGLGGQYPWVTLARDDKDFNSASGDYWRGAIWLPTSYMGIKALEKYGYDELADKTAARLLNQMNDTYKNYEPHTIWECYNPSKAEPSTKRGKCVRPDFCGWSALGPISLFIENILGFHSVDAQKNEIKWRLHQTCRHGIQHLRFGKTVTDILYNGNGTVTVNSDQAYTLVINGTPFEVKPGDNRFDNIKPRQP
jgi:hypothetical protein